LVPGVPSARARVDLRDLVGLRAGSGRTFGHHTHIIRCSFRHSRSEPDTLCSLRAIDFRTHLALLTEVLFLRKQLTMLLDRGIRPRRARRLDHLWLVLLSKCFDWRDALFIFKPATLVRWQKDLVRRLWRWKSRPTGRPALAAEVRDLIARMAMENPSWGCCRIAGELRLKLGLLVSARTCASI